MKTIKYIATGLIKLKNNQEKNKTLYPFPPELIRGLNMLSAEYINKGMDYPRNISEAIELFNTPLSQWGILENWFDEDDVLIEDGITTELCNEFFVSGQNIEDEITQKELVEVMKICKLEEDEESYVHFRRSIIEYPLAKERDILKISNEFINRDISAKYKNSYENIPPYAIKDNRVYKCGYCGWTIEWDEDGNPSCISSICREETNNFRKIIPLENNPKELVRLRPGMMAYISKPGMYELQLEKKLEKMGLKVDMWPKFDAYDLRLTFPDNEVWAVDVKDWRNPYLLVASLKEFPYETEYSKAFYVIPQYRYRHHGDYRDVFKTKYNYPRKNVFMEMEKSFLKKVKNNLDWGAK